jgi:hypothetical protein
MKKVVNFAALTLVAFIAFSCQKDITPTKEIFGTGLNPNTPASLEKVPEADFDENKLNLPASFAFDVSSPFGAKWRHNWCFVSKRKPKNLFQ